jgi:hypothetical protein
VGGNAPGGPLGDPLNVSIGSGCPHEKQKEACPGVAIVVIPQAGQRTCKIGGCPPGGCTPIEAGVLATGAGAAAMGVGGVAMGPCGEGDSA